MTDPEAHIYRVFGLTLSSNLPFANRLLPGSPPIDVSLDWCSSPCGPEETSPGLELPQVSEAEAYVHSLDGGRELLRFPGVADFYLETSSIRGHLTSLEARELAEILFLGATLAYWLERQEILTLHASAVEFDGGAVAFLSHHGGGKTGLASTLVQLGRRLLTDDILAVDGQLRGRSGYPQMRMWPDEAAHFFESWEQLERVHPEHDKRRVPIDLESFCAESLPLKCLYLPSRDLPGDENQGVEFEPLSPRDAVIELVRHSYAPRIVEESGWQRRRLEMFARLVERVPVRAIRYPSGFERLPAVCQEIGDDLEGLRGSG